MLKCDLSSEAEILTTFKWIEEEMGGVDVCINNAGFTRNAPLLSGPTESWSEMLQVPEILTDFCQNV